MSDSEKYSPPAPVPAAETSLRAYMGEAAVLSKARAAGGCLDSSDCVEEEATGSG